MSDRSVPEAKTVVIEWVEESQHQVTVRVPIGFDPDSCNLGDALAELNDDGFRGMERSQIAVFDVAHDPVAEYFDPTRYEVELCGVPDDLPESPEGDVALIIPGEVWRAFLAQEMLLDDEAPGPVSLWAVVGELKFMVAEHERARITT